MREVFGLYFNPPAHVLNPSLDEKGQLHALALPNRADDE